jgi:hypothetical protein
MERHFSPVLRPGDSPVPEPKEDLAVPDLSRCLRMCFTILLLASWPGMTAGAAPSPKNPASLPVPARLMALIPEDAANRGGTYNSAGQVAIGEVHGDLASHHPCTEGEVFPGRLRISFWVLGDTRVFRMQVGPAMKQAQTDAREEFETRVRQAGQGGSSRLIRIGPVTSVEVPGGSMVYYDQLSTCFGGGPRKRPDAWLKGTARNKTGYMLFEIEGPMTGKEAVDLGLEVMRKYTGAQ